MPIFEIEKDGKTYEVNARDEDTALAAIAGEDPSFASKAAHVAKGVGQAAVDVLDMPYNMNQLAEKATSFLPETMKTAGNKALEMTIPGLSGYRAVEQYLPDFARLEKPVSELPGLKQAKEKLASREFERGVSPGADALRIAAEWGTGGLPNAFRKGARVLPDVIAGAGAATGDYLSQLAGSDSPWGEIAGGVAAAIAGGRMPSKLKTDSKAVEFVEKNLDDPKAVQDAVEAGVARGEKGTTADLAADQGMFDIEQGVVTNDLATRKAFLKAEQDRAAQIAEDLQTPFAGDPAQAQVAAKDLTKRRAQVIKDQLKAEQANIASQAAETSQELAERGRIAQASDESAQAQAALMAQRAEEALSLIHI